MSIKGLDVSKFQGEPDWQYITYVIQPGDTLGEIAQRFGTTVNALTKLNTISDPDKIYAGNTIRVPENMH